MNLYEQLGIEKTATNDEIKRAYYRMVRLHSPEKDPETFIRIRSAYEQLSNKDKKAAYDAKLAQFIDIPDDVAAVVMQIDQMRSQGLSVAAIELVERKLEEYANNSASNHELRRALCEVYLDVGMSGKAVNIAEDLVTRDPTNTKNLCLAVNACMKRGWTTRAKKYMIRLMELDTGCEEHLFASMDKSDMNPKGFGKLVEEVEKHGKKAPLLCVCVLNQCIMAQHGVNFYNDIKQLDLFGKVVLLTQDWDDTKFAAEKLIEHTQEYKKGINKEKDEFITNYLHTGILGGMAKYDYYEIFPQVNQVIKNLNFEELFQTPEYIVAEISFSAIEAVLAGVPKPLAAYAMSRAYQECDIFDETEKLSYRNEAIAFEIDILLEYDSFKPYVARFRERFEELYLYAADFLETIKRYNHQKVYDEARRRYNKHGYLDERYTFDWLDCGEDDKTQWGYEEIQIDYDKAQKDYDKKQKDYDKTQKDYEYRDYYNADFLGNADEFDYFENHEPVRVEKIGRNDPCKCGSGKKYKKCCGR